MVLVIMKENPREVEKRSWRMGEIRRGKGIKAVTGRGAVTGTAREAGTGMEREAGTGSEIGREAGKGAEMGREAKTGNVIETQRRKRSRTVITIIETDTGIVVIEG